MTTILVRIGVTFLGAAVAFLVSYGLMYLLGIGYKSSLVYAGLYSLAVAAVGWAYMNPIGNDDDGTDEV